MGREALEAAIANYRGEKSAVINIEGEVICECFGVTDEEIKKVVRENALTSVEDVTNYTKAGGGCGQCRGKIEEILKEISESGRQQIPSSIKTPDHKKLSNVQKMHMVEELIETRIRPALKHDHGDLQLIDIVDDTVFVTLKGACSTCPSSGTTLRQFVEKEIQKNISKTLKVEEVKN